MSAELMTPGVDQASFLELVRSRRATRSFSGEPVSLTELEALVEAARWAPSPSNRQPWKFVSIADPARLQLMRDAVAVAGQRLLDSREGSEAKALEDYIKHFVFFTSAPVVFAVLIRRTQNRLAESNGSDIELEGAHMAAGMAMQNLLLAAVARGLVACPMSGPMIACPALEAILGISSPWHLMALIPVGWPGPDQPPAPERRRLDLIWTHVPAKE